MAFWDRITARGNVEDRRGMAPAIGGLSLTGIALLMLFNVLAGGDATDILSQLEGIPLQIENNTAFEGEDEYEVFSSAVLGSNNEYWRGVAHNTSRSYNDPRLVLFRVATPSECGTASSEVGPHYCPIDNTIYLDETFFDELTKRFGATGGDVAEAYVIAHEVGHHVQNEFGTMQSVQELQQLNPAAQNDLSIKLELQADCYAGLWAKSIESLNVLEPGEIREAMDAAAAVGDDRIQESVVGYSSPETWTHGSSDQRVEWFNSGYNSGKVESCNTFE